MDVRVTHLWKAVLRASRMVVRSWCSPARTVLLSFLPKSTGMPERKQGARAAAGRSLVRVGSFRGRTVTARRGTQDAATSEEAGWRRPRHSSDSLP